MSEKPSKLHIVPVSWQDVRAFVDDWHRKLRSPKGYKFAVGDADCDNVLVGVAIVGRPTARNLQDGQTLEVTRTAVADGAKNANSALYGACWRAARALGYTRLITYTERDESGVSLRAAGWRELYRCRPNPGWDRPSRRREARGFENKERLLWEAPQ